MYSGGLDEQRRGIAPNRRHVVKSSTNLAISLAPRTVRGLLCRSGAKCIGRQPLTRECGFVHQSHGNTSPAAARRRETGFESFHISTKGGFCGGNRGALL